MIRIISVIVLTAAMASGCASVISTGVLERVNSDITFEALKKAPQSHKGEVVLLAGVIVDTTLTPTGATLEIYQTGMDWENRPKNPDRSEGRFLAEYQGFLDPEIYSRGRQVTVAGKILGVKVKKLGEMDYAYPLLRAEEIYLWEKEKPLPRGPYPGYDPWGPWGFWGPWYPRYSPYWYY